MMPKVESGQWRVDPAIGTVARAVGIGQRREQSELGLPASAVWT